MIIITGATGQLGAQIVDQLLQRVPTDQVGVSVRDPERAAGLAARGVRVRRGDYTDPDSLGHAFADASQVLLISANTTGPESLAQHTTAIDAARDAGAQRIIYTSHQAAHADTRFAPMPDHAATERYLAQLGTPVTVLRNGFYAATIPQLLGRALDTGELVAPADGPVSWTAHADLATAAAAVLAEPGRFDGPTPALTAPVAVDLAGVAEILSELTGRTIRRVVADDNEWVAGLVEHGVPEGSAQMLLGMFHASRAGEFTTTGPTLTSLIGREPLSVRQLLAGVVASR
jgi:NAD(P)H dehydrogenase (quinone)